MKHRILLAIFLVFAVVCLLPIPAGAQEVVASPIHAEDFWSGVSVASPRTCYAVGHWFVFWRAPAVGGFSYVYYSVSEDGESWSTPVSTEVEHKQGYSWTFRGFFIATSGEDEGDYIDVAATGGTSQEHYRRGVFVAATDEEDAHIDWLAPVQHFTLAGTERYVTGLGIDTNGYPWFGEFGMGYTGIILVYAAKSSTKDGTFTYDTGMPYNLEYAATGSTDAMPMVKPVALTSGKMAIVYSVGSNLDSDFAKIKVARWTGTAFGASATSAIKAMYSYWDVTVNNDDVFIVAAERATYDIEYCHWAYSSPSTFDEYTTLNDSLAEYAAPVINLGTDTEYQFVWYALMSTDIVYLDVYNSDETTWYVDYEWINETDTVTKAYPLGGMRPTAQANIGLAYEASTDILKFKVLGEVLDVATNVPDPIEATSATLQGEILALGMGSATYRCFYINDSPTLTGATLEGNETGTFGVGVFTHAVSGLTEGDTYYVIAYASNDYGEDWGWWYKFTAGGEGSDIVVVTLDPTSVKDISATFNANLISAPGGCIMRGFEYGMTETATWEVTEGGDFALGNYSISVTGLQADSLYYVRAIAGNETSEDHGQWIGFITEVPGYNVPGDDFAPLFPGTVPTTAPGGWIRPDKDYNGFPIISPIINAFADLGFGRSFFWFTVEVFLIVVLTIVGAKFTKHLPLTFFMLLVLFLLPFIAFEYLDWWMLAPYLLVGAALMIKEGQFSWS